MTTMLGFLTVLLCATVVWADVTPIPTFKLDGMKGKWYSLGVATNAKWFATHKAHMKMGTVEIIPTDDGDLNMTVTILNNGTCFKTNHLAKKTNTSGQFTCHSDRSGSDNVIRIIDANFDEYAILHVTKTKKGESSVLVKLYSRMKHMCKCVEDKFWKYSKDSGIDKENILIFSPSHSNSSPPHPL